MTEKEKNKISLLQSMMNTIAGLSNDIVSDVNFNESVSYTVNKDGHRVYMTDGQFEYKITIATGEEFTWHHMLYDIAGEDDLYKKAIRLLVEDICYIERD